MTAEAHPFLLGLPSRRTILGRLLRLPLAAKLAGANALIVIGALMATYVDHRMRGADYRMVAVLAVALLAALVVNATLVTIALRPIRDLEETAERFWKGDLAARVPWSAVSDRGIEKLSDALNLLLASNEEERLRVRALTEGVLRHENQERVDVARVLQESHAQSLAGLTYCLSAALAECDENGECRRHIEAARQIAQRGIEDLRELSSRVHPSLLDDFGLIAAVRQLARAVEKEYAGVHVHVRHEDVESMRHVTPPDEALLYRATEEAVRSASLLPTDIELELTEATLLRDTEVMRSVLGELHRDGFRLALDDFGTGYCSVAYLRHFPIDTLKVDGSFVQEITSDSYRRDLVPLSRAVVRVPRR